MDSDWSCSLNGDMGDLGPFVGASFQTAEVIWEVRLTREWENHWRESAGQFALDVWAALHEWDANCIVSGSVMVYGLDNNHAYVEAEIFFRDEQGHIICGPYTKEPIWQRQDKALVQSLPEGIGEVTYVSQFPYRSE